MAYQAIIPVVLAQLQLVRSFLGGFEYAASIPARVDHCDATQWIMSSHTSVSHFKCLQVF